MQKGENTQKTDYPLRRRGKSANEPKRDSTWSLAQHFIPKLAWLTEGKENRRQDRASTHNQSKEGERPLPEAEASGETLWASSGTVDSFGEGILRRRNRNEKNSAGFGREKRKDRLWGEAGKSQYVRNKVRQNGLLKSFGANLGGTAAEEDQAKLWRKEERKLSLQAKPLGRRLSGTCPITPGIQKG